jgi:hypothetical protein
MLAGTLTLAPTSLALAAASPQPSPRPHLTWRLPLANSELLRPFTPPTRRYGRGHRGVDLATALGSVVCAPADATIAFVGQVNKVPTVVLAHAAGYRSTYQSVTSGLKVGAKVLAGKPFGKVSAVGHLPGAISLHWGLLQGETYLDPLSLLAHFRTHLLPS